MCEGKFVYRCMWFKNMRSTKSHTDMFYLNAKDTEWIFDTCDFLNGLARVEYVKVCKDSSSYTTATFNSLLKEKQPNKPNLNPSINDDFIFALNGC